MTNLSRWRYWPFSGILFLAGCGAAPPRASENLSKPPIEVQAFSVQVRDIPLLYTVTGTVHARVQSPLASQIVATIVSVRVNTGDSVRAGERLILLDTQATEAGYHKAQASLAEAQNSIAETENGMLAARANLDLAAVTAERMNDLYIKRSISKQELDETNAKLKTAQANYEIAKTRRAQVTERLAQSDATLEEAKITAAYTSIRAPFAGVITARNAEPGMLAIPGNTLLTLESGNSFRLHAEVEESRIGMVQPKESATVMLDAMPGEVRGQVSEISPVSDNNAHSYTVKIDLPENLSIHSGQFGHASFAAGTKHALTLPSAALVENGQLDSVFVNDGGAARLRLITVGDKREEQVEVLSGLQPGERVICPIPNGLADGDRVRERP